MQPMGVPVRNELLAMRRETESAEVDKAPRAVILAAGRGERFFRSGGRIYKQLAPYRGEPVVTRLVRQSIETNAFSGVTVVLGADAKCADAIRDELASYDVRFVINEESLNDQNLLSFIKGTDGLQDGALIIESDCVVTGDDLRGMVQDLQEEEIRWSNIGSLEAYSYGGVVELDPASMSVTKIDILDKEAFSKLLATGRPVMKMFGLTAFGGGALVAYRQAISELESKFQKYFHYVAINSPERFRQSTRSMSAESFSFNAVSEMML